jgi:predicted phosphohydrolase
VLSTLTSGDLLIRAGDLAFCSSDMTDSIFQAGPDVLGQIIAELQVPEKLKQNFGGSLDAEDGVAALRMLAVFANSPHFGGIDAAKRLCQKFLQSTERWSQDKPEECRMLWHYLAKEEKKAAAKLFEPLELLTQMVMGDPGTWYQIIVGVEFALPEDAELTVSQGTALSSSSRIRRMGFEMYHEELSAASQRKLNEGGYIYVESAASFKELGPNNTPALATELIGGNLTLGAVRVVVISDTHGFHRRLAHLPAGDLLIHAGDLGYEESRGEPELMRRRLDDAVGWLSEQSQFKHKVLIGGNHDFLLEQMPPAERLQYFALYAESGLHYLDDTMRPTKLDFGDSRALTVWGSAISLWKERGENKAFSVMESGAEKKGAFETVEGWHSRVVQESIGGEKVDILITHSPPQEGLGGSVKACPSKIMRLVEEVKPALYVCGHAHTVDLSTSIGSFVGGDTLAVNAAVVDKWNSLNGLPLVMDIKGKG